MSSTLGFFSKMSMLLILSSYLGLTALSHEFHSGFSRKIYMLLVLSSYLGLTASSHEFHSGVLEEDVYAVDLVIISGVNGLIT